MVFKFNLSDKVTECLKCNPGRKFSTREIGRWILENYPADCEMKRRNSQQDLSSDTAFLDQIRAEIKPSLFKDNERIKIPAGQRPRQYYWAASDSEEAEKAEIRQESLLPDEPQEKNTEAELYPLLMDYLRAELHIYPMRIDEKTSKNSKGKNGNKWLHPDIVALEDLSRKWSREVREFAKKAFAESIFLWSFEVKSELNRQNVRESFFQAVSNSSWAHYGYLAAAEIGEEIMQELNMLANAHDIGVIKLDENNPAESQILISASGERNTDWDIIDRISKENRDFEKYINAVSEVCGGSNPEGQNIWHRLQQEDE